MSPSRDVYKVRKKKQQEYLKRKFGVGDNEYIHGENVLPCIDSLYDRQE